MKMQGWALGAKCGDWGASGLTEAKLPPLSSASNPSAFNNEARASPPIPLAAVVRKSRRVSVMISFQSGPFIRYDANEGPARTQAPPGGVLPERLQRGRRAIRSAVAAPRISQRAPAGVVGREVLPTRSGRGRPRSGI